MNLEYIKECNRRVNYRMTWTDDREVYGIPDFWATYKEILAKFGPDKWEGDCDDYSGMKYYLLKEAGCPIDQLFMIICTYLPTNECHMILSWWETEDPWILDNIDPIVWKASERTDLLPLIGFNEKKIVDYRT